MNAEVRLDRPIFAVSMDPYQSKTLQLRGSEFLGTAAFGESPQTVDASAQNRKPIPPRTVPSQVPCVLPI